MPQKDYWTDILHRKEKADEDRYFAEQDRQLIEKSSVSASQPK